MKITVLLIVGNGGDFYQKWIDHYQNCEFIDNIVVAHGYTKKWNDAGIKCDKQEVIYNPNKTTIDVSNSLYEDKTEQQNKALSLIEDTDYVWIADVDEFYHYSDIGYIKNELEKNHYTYVEFFMYHFFKNFNTIGYGGDGWAYDTPVPRIFKYDKGQKFTSHRPIQMLNKEGVDLKIINPLIAVLNPVRTYHYAFIDKDLVCEKMTYYSSVFNRDYIAEWYLPVFNQWNQENKKEIEDKYSVHPSCENAKTIEFKLQHPI